MFRTFVFALGSRSLTQEGKPVEIGSRAFDLLAVLLRSKGNLVSKDEIFSYVWPSTRVEESNLRFQMATLRKALGLDRDLIKTVPGRGYLFTLERAEAGGPRPQVERSATPTVVVIDDDEGTRDALGGLLESTGLRVELHGSVQSFLARPSPVQVDCLILDVWMPGQNGLSFQKDLRSDGHTMPIIFISGHADVPMSVQAMKAGAVEFLTKPVRHQDLLAAVRDALDITDPHFVTV